VKSTQPETVPERTSATILLVEDEEMVRRATAEFLEVCGFRVLTANDGIEGLEIAEAHPEFDLLITDIVMPRMKGTEMAVALRRRFPDLPILFMTGYTQIPMELSEFEGAAMLHKPFALAEITRSVQALLRNKRTSEGGQNHERIPC
jgi:two-component system cell cycle sensor histidine kinase/response regulator CckA